MTAVDHVLFINFIFISFFIFLFIFYFFTNPSQLIYVLYIRINRFICMMIIILLLFMIFYTLLIHYLYPEKKDNSYLYILYIILYNRYITKSYGQRKRRLLCMI